MIKEYVNKRLHLVILVCVVFVAFAIIYISEGEYYSGMSNEEIVLQAYIYKNLKVCNEKLGAYGEDVNFDILLEDLTAENLTTCLEKLGAYGEKVDLPLGR